MVKTPIITSAMKLELRVFENDLLAKMEEEMKEMEDQTDTAIIEALEAEDEVAKLEMATLEDDYTELVAEINKQVNDMAEMCREKRATTARCCCIQVRKVTRRQSRNRATDERMWEAVWHKT